MSRKKKKNSTNPSGNKFHIPGDFYLPFRNRKEAPIVEIELGNDRLLYPFIFPTFYELAKDTKYSDESFWKAIKGLLSFPINISVMAELNLKPEVLEQILERSKETISLIDDLPTEVLATARVFIADGMDFLPALHASRKI